jgi:hypothetical protein
MRKLLTYNRYFTLGAAVWTVGVLAVYENLGFAAGTVAGCLYLVLVPLIIDFSARRATSLKLLTLLASVAVQVLLVRATRPAPVEQQMLVKAGLHVVTIEGKQ